MENANRFQPLAEAAVNMIRDDLVVGLGSGRAARAFIEALGKRTRAGLRIRGVATSQATAKLAESLEIPLVTLDEVETIDIDFDGADEVDPRLDLIKGRGGALVREKIVAAAARRVVVLVGVEKIVSTLGAQGVLPVEIVPFARAPVRRRVARLGYPASPREVRGKAFVTDNGNYVLDCRVPTLENPLEVEQAIRAIPGVVGTGLFLGVADTVLIQSGDNVEVRHRERGA